MGKLHGQEKKRILFDEYHAAVKPSEHLLDIILELEDRGYILGFSEKQITSSLLSEYDALVVLVPSRDFHGDEREAIKLFVENGGSLIIFGENKEYMEEKKINNTINSISKSFGIEFNKDVVLDSEKNRKGEERYPIINNFKQHPITRGIKSIGYISGCSLTVNPPATALAFGNSTTTTDPETQKGEDIEVLAVAEYGKGKVLAIGDIDFLIGSSTLGYRDEDYLSFMDNEDLALNIFEWSASIREITKKAERLELEGYDLFSQRDYSQAKLEFEKALELYTEIDNNQKVSEIQEMIARCDKGLEAEAASQRGTEYHRKKEYNNALTEFEKSKSLYDEIGDSVRSQYVQSKIDECNMPLDAKAAYEKGMEYYDKGEYNMAIAKFEEAIALYEEFGNNERVEELQEKIQGTQKTRDKIEVRKRMLVLIGIFLVVLIVFMFVYVFLRKPKALSESDASSPKPVPVLCHSCGKENVRGASYCSHCGTPLKPLDELEKEKMLEDMRKKYEEGEITEEEYSRIMGVLEKSL